ncbi:MAG: hypothetical protein ACR2PI_05565 [Hyphomicrobiaceae bacterium]
MAPAIALPAPTIEAPLPTQRASNAPVLNEQRGAPSPRQNSTAPAARNNEAVRLAPVGVRRAPGGETSTPEKSTPDTPALVKTAPIRDPRLPAGRSLDENTETDREHLAQLRKERFRRRAAESARKEIEGMADNLREQLGREVSARRKAEGVAAELVSRASLENQIDQERDRLRSQKIRQLEQRRTLLEREVKTLTQRLVQERAKRKQLEDEKAALAKKVVDARQGTTSGTDLAALKAKVSDLQRKLNAAEWARKLAEAQLRVVTGKNESAPATTRGQSN